MGSGSPGAIQGSSQSRTHPAADRARRADRQGRSGRIHQRRPRRHSWPARRGGRDAARRANGS